MTFRLKNRLVRSILTISGMMILLSGCAYYNTFYNAEQAFEDAEKIIEETKKQEEGDIPQQAKKLLSQSIEKSRKVIEEYPNSKYVDDAFFLVGKSSFIKGDYKYAERHFKKILSEYPQSKFSTESNIWLAYTYLRMNEFDSTNAAITQIKNSKVKLEKYHKQLLYQIQGELAVLQGSIDDAYKNFEEAIKFASTDGKKAAMVEDLVKISEKNQDYEKAIYFLEKLDIYAQSDEIKHDAKLKWMKYNRQLGNLENVQDEIDKLLNRSDYEPLYLALELERAKILLSQGNIEEAKENFLYIVDNNSKKKETAEAYYLLGLYNLQHNWDLDKAKEYLDKVKLEYSRSIYKEPARDLKNTINVYQGLEANFTSKQSGDTSAVEFEVSEEEKEEEIFNMSSSNFNLNMGTNLPGQNFRRDLEEEDPTKSVVIKGTVDSLLFAMGEILYFDFQQLDSAKSRFEFLYTNYPESKFTPQAVYVMSRTIEDSLQWRDILKKEYPESEYATHDSLPTLVKNESKNLDELRDNAWGYLDSSPQQSAQSFLALADSTKDPTSFYAAAYIYDYYLNDIDNTIQFYQSYIDSFPSHEFVVAAEERLSLIQQAIEDTIQTVSDSTEILTDTAYPDGAEADLELEEIPEFLPELPPSFYQHDSIEIKPDIQVEEFDTNLIIPIQKDKSETLELGPPSVLPVEDKEPIPEKTELVEIEVGVQDIDTKVRGTVATGIPLITEKAILWKKYMVQSGESLESIAQKFYNNIQMADSIHQWNFDIIGQDPSVIYPYTALQMHAVEGDTIPQEINYVDHIVEFGESLWHISDKVYGNPYMWMLLFTDNLDALNLEKDLIIPGDTLLVRKSFSSGDQ